MFNVPVSHHVVRLMIALTSIVLVHAIIKKSYPSEKGSLHSSVFIVGTL